MGNGQFQKPTSKPTAISSTTSITKSNHNSNSNRNVDRGSPWITADHCAKRPIRPPRERHPHQMEGLEKAPRLAAHPSLLEDFLDSPVPAKPRTRQALWESTLVMLACSAFRFTSRNRH